MSSWSWESWPIASGSLLSWLPIRSSCLELGELADRLGQPAQLVAGKMSCLELGELADRLGQRV